MRDQLRPFEGQLVFVHGRLTEASRRDDKHYFMMRRPQITPWDGASAVDLSNPVTTVDHLWVDMPLGEMEMMKECFGLTRIRYYARSNGSVDLGCEPLYHLLDCDDFLCRFHKNLPGHKPKMEDHVLHLDAVLLGLKYHGKVLPNGLPSYVFSRIKSLQEINRFFQRWQKQLLAQQTAQLKAKAGDRGKHRPCRSAGSFADLLR